MEYALPALLDDKKKKGEANKQQEVSM